MANPQKIATESGNDNEWVPAEVVSVDYMAKTRDRLYTIYCKPMTGGSSRRPSDVVQARALHANIKQIPIIGEIVLICQAPTPFHAGASSAKEFYYTMPVSIQSSVHHNGLPAANDVKDIPNDTKVKMALAAVGVVSTVEENKTITKTIDPTFPERSDLFPIQPFSGDLIIEGRWGQSIRLGSTVDLRREYISPPNWSKGVGDTGNPITIISNGSNPKKEEKTYNEFHIESPDDDDASIWLTSGQSVKFKPASKFTPSITDKEIDLFRKNDYGGNQIIIASDRLILNANKQEIVGFAKEGIGFATEKCLVLNAENIVEIEAKERISIGFNATSPVLLGDRVVDMLGQLINLLIDMNKSISQQTHPTGVGPSGPPINAGEFVGFITKLSGMLPKLPQLASKLAFVNEFAGGPSAADTNKFVALKSTDYVLPVPSKTSGDTSGGVSFANTVPGPSGISGGGNTGVTGGTNTGNNTGTETGSNTGNTGTGTNTGTETGSNTGNTGTGTNTGTNTGTGNETGTGTGTGSETGTGTGTGSETGTGTNTTTGTSGTSSERKTFTKEDDIVIDLKSTKFKFNSDYDGIYVTDVIFDYLKEKTYSMTSNFGLDNLEKYTVRLDEARYKTLEEFGDGLLGVIQSVPIVKRSGTSSIKVEYGKSVRIGDRVISEPFRITITAP